MESFRADALAIVARAMKASAWKFPLPPEPEAPRYRPESADSDWNRWPLICRESAESIVEQNAVTHRKIESCGQARDAGALQPSARSTMSERSRDRPDVSLMRDSSGSRLGLAAGLQRAPGAERGRHARRQLRILRIEREDDVGDEVVAGAVGAIELGRIGLGKGADQSAHAVRLANERAGCAVAKGAMGQRIGVRCRGLQREPFYRRSARRRHSAGRNRPVPGRGPARRAAIRSPALMSNT